MSGAHLNFEWDPVKARANLTKHGVSFKEAATVLADPLALTVFDAEHSQSEERWFTLGSSSEGRLLAVAHTFTATAATIARVRIISAREATPKERQEYENALR
jgi:uncharacterized DUF497 family protein